MIRPIDLFLDLLPERIIDIGLRSMKRMRIQKGRHIFNHEWDVLVILDACRYDMYNEIIGRGEPVLSVASTSGEWIEDTFIPKYKSIIKNTAYISANPFSQQVNESDFGLVNHVWQHHWDDNLGTVPPEPVTDIGLTAARSGKYDRIILHYMQPHAPFIGGEQFGQLGRHLVEPEGNDDSQNVWRMVERGEISADQVKESYYKNLEYIYKKVKILLENIDGRVVLTSDHANALGEWNLWGHRAYVPFRAVREVPWDVYDCTDKESYKPEEVDINQNETNQKNDITEHLRSLGYVDQ